MGKITIERETLERAITALTYHQNQTRPIERTRISLDALRAALAAQQAEPQEPVASYWLIECKNGFTGWYTSHRLDCRFFDTDPRKACKFASKELAENEINERGHSCMTATEHVDIAAVPPDYALVPTHLAVDQLEAFVGHGLCCGTEPIPEAVIDAGHRWARLLSRIAAAGDNT